MKKIYMMLCTLLITVASFAQSDALLTYTSQSSNPGVWLASKNINTAASLTIADVNTDVVKNYIKALGTVTSSGTYTIAKPTYTDYVVWPSKNDPYLTFRDHEVTTINGSTLGLNIVSMSSTFINSLPASQTNGAFFSHQGVFREDMIGTGNIPWLTITASGIAGGPSVTLNAFANQTPDNGAASYFINAGRDNIFRVGTDFNKAYVGYLNTTNTTLTFGAEQVNVTGQLQIAGGIKSAEWLIAGNTSNNIKITSGGISFLNNSDQSYIGSSFYGNSQSEKSFVIQSSLSNIIFNAVSMERSSRRSIEFAFDFHSILQLTPAVITFLKPTIRQKMHDAEIYAIESPEEGLELYSLDQHAHVFFNGKKWMVATGLKELPKPSGSISL